MKKLSYSLLLLLVVILLIMSACSAGSSGSKATETATIDGASLLQERCTVCHSLSRVTSQRLSAEEWKSIVFSMVRRGAVLNPQEETILTDYLVSNFAP